MFVGTGALLRADLTGVCCRCRASDFYMIQGRPVCLCLDCGCDISDSMRAVAICSSFCSSETCSRHTALSSPSLIFMTARKKCEDPSLPKSCEGSNLSTPAAEIGALNSLTDASTDGLGSPAPSTCCTADQQHNTCWNIQAGHMACDASSDLKKQDGAGVCVQRSHLTLSKISSSFSPMRVASLSRGKSSPSPVRSFRSSASALPSSSPLAAAVAASSAAALGLATLSALKKLFISKAVRPMFFEFCC